jgi:hypothetical protein
MRICRILVNVEKYLDIYCWGLLTVAAVALLIENYRTELRNLSAYAFSAVSLSELFSCAENFCKIHFCSNMSNRDSNHGLCLSI